jgi:hypothetical protein
MAAFRARVLHVWRTWRTSSKYLLSLTLSNLRHVAAFSGGLPGGALSNWKAANSAISATCPPARARDLSRPAGSTLFRPIACPPHASGVGR